MKHLLFALLTVIAATILTSLSVNAQSFEDRLKTAEEAKVKYGETDDRYLAALSNAIQGAFGEGRNEEANKYRLIHLEIVKKKFGENSLEYAEDLWRLANVSRYKGEDYTFACYDKAREIYESNNSQSSLPYCLIMRELFYHYYIIDELYTAIEYLKKYVGYGKQWVNKEWNGTKFLPIAVADGQRMLGYLYYEKGYFSSSVEAYKECIKTLEDNNLIEEYEGAVQPYHGIAIDYMNLGRDKEQAEWSVKYLEIVKDKKGDTSDEYIEGLSWLSGCFWNLEDIESIKKTLNEQISAIEKRDQENGTNVYQDTLYINAQKSLWMSCGAFEDYSGYIECIPKLLDTFEKAGMDETYDYWDALGDLILAYHNMGRYSEEYSLFDKYESLSARLGQKNSEEYWEFLGLKAEVFTLFHKEHKEEEYSQVIEELTSLTEVIYGKNSFQEAVVAYRVAKQKESLDKNAEAEEWVKKCYSILNSSECRNIGNADSLAMIAGLNNLEGMIYTPSNPDLAEEKLLLSLNEFKKIGIKTELPLINLGLLYLQQRHDYRKSYDYFDKGRLALEAQGDNYSLQYIIVMNNIGLSLLYLGENSLAMNIINHISETVSASYGKQNPIYGMIELNKAVFYYSITDYESAIECVGEALKCFGQAFGRDSEKYATCLLNLALLYQNKGDYSKSKGTLLEAIPILEKLQSPNTIYALINLSSNYGYEKDVDKVIETAKKAEKILIENKWQKTDIAASLYASVGYSLLINGNPNARRYLEYALDIFRDGYGEGNVRYYGGLLCLDLASFLDGSESEEMIHELYSQYKDLYLNDAAYYTNNERESLISGSRFSMTKNILFSSRGQGKADTDLYNFLLFNKGLLLGTSLGYSKAIYESGNEEIIDEYRKLLDLNRFIDGETFQIDTSLTIDEAKEQASMIERDISLYLRQNGGYTDNLSYSYSDIVQSLDKNETAIEFINYNDLVDGKDYYAALVARKDWASPKFIKLCTKSDLEKILSSSPSALYGETEISQNAYNLIWAPLDSCLNDAKTVYFSPAGYLNKLAIEQIYNGEKRFSDLHNAVRLTSTREICWRTKHAEYSSAVLYGGLEYDEDDATMIEESRNVRGLSSAPADVFIGLPSETERSGWGYLPGTLKEVKDISSMMTKSKFGNTVYSAQKGNEESFKTLSGKKFDILHIATHGYYMTEPQAERINFFTSGLLADVANDGSISPLQRSGLLLSGANKAWQGEKVPDGVEDGILTAAEISNLDLSSCDLVVLSACETGLGDITDEGVYGLQRAFKNAGVSTLIMSLWEVDDEATALMMRTFYNNLINGKSTREAFFLAQDKTRKSYPDPRYWAAFILLDAID